MPRPARQILLQEGEDGVLPFSIHLYLRKDGECDVVMLLGKSLHICQCAWLLTPKLIAWEGQDLAKIAHTGCGYELVLR